ncbi:DNA ligase [Orgyia leucostigma nucleopolyhedrovirus]|uniref:DNA ligase n=1 Tax=Orgyia leucostigma nucleopolyhedrovirus TaxID=490711 RepID=B0FDP6_9ABAC|nr:DNA ligase [Orgyia leucostigma nucleopolyhedrovirus]ABY65754.1 DNA ligase [Orgyia leucostigma nucleopolyhedrovirus]
MEDNSYRDFVNLCASITAATKLAEKTEIIRNHLNVYAPSATLKFLYCQMLLPKTMKSFNINNKTLINAFARTYGVPSDNIVEDIKNSGDMALVLAKVCGMADDEITQSISLNDVFTLLMAIVMIKKNEDKIVLLTNFLTKCVASDVEIIVRLINRKLTTGANVKQVMDALHPLALNTYKTTSCMITVFRRHIDAAFLCEPSENNCDDNADNVEAGPSQPRSAEISVFLPVEPMLAEACKTVAMALKKCPDGMLVETKYDGERVQVHYTNNEAKFYSRTLKPLASHKSFCMYSYLLEAFGPVTENAILDAEIVLVDDDTDAVLPFGTLGVNMKRKHPNGIMCLYVFDCLLLDNEPLIHLPLAERKKKLQSRLTPVRNRVMLAETHNVTTHEQLVCLLNDAVNRHLEGLMVKPLLGKYEPGKRRWLKIKKDYLCNGEMADSIDLVVLGAQMGTGKKGGQLSIFLMGCRNEEDDTWVAITKVHSGFTDSDFNVLQNKLKPLMVRIETPPAWLKCNKRILPDYVAVDPKRMPVWQIIGSQLTKSNSHTPDGVSVRFPRVSSVREDKNWRTASTLQQIRVLYETSQQQNDFVYNETREHNLQNRQGVKRKLPF